jgi:hypothetical protein
MEEKMRRLLPLLAVIIALATSPWASAAITFESFSVGSFSGGSVDGFNLSVIGSSGGIDTGGNPDKKLWVSAGFIDSVTLAIEDAGGGVFGFESLDLFDNGSGYATSPVEVRAYDGDANEIASAAYALSDTGAWETIIAGDFIGLEISRLEIDLARSFVISPSALVDNESLDNVVLTREGVVDDVPEPATWLTWSVLAGLGLVGSRFRLVR